MKDQHTTKDIITLLPFDEAFRNELLSEYDKLQPDELFEFEQIIWNTYDALFSLQLQTNLQIELNKLKNSTEAIKKGIYEQVYAQTVKDFPSELSAMKSTTDLSSAREQLGKIMEKPEDNPA